MKSEWNIRKCKDFINFNPGVPLKKGTITRKFPMEILKPYYKYAQSDLFEEYKGGAKFINNDTIMARITPCLENGKISFIDCLETGEVAYGSTEFIVLRAIKDVSDAQFIYYLTLYEPFKNAAISSMTGSSGRQRVQLDALKECEINIPSLKIQQKIGSILRSLDEKIRLNTQINDNLEQQAKKFYKRLFEDSDSAQGILSDIANITMGQSPIGSSFNEQGNGEVFFQGRAEFGKRFPTRRLYTTNPKRMARIGDTLLSVRAPVGDMNMAYEPCGIGRGLAAITSKSDNYSFLYYLLLTLKSKFDSFNGEGTVFGSINKDNLSNFVIPIYPQKIINYFDNIVNPIDRKIYLLHKENLILTNIRDSLLPKLMSGELDVSNLDI